MFPFDMHGKAKLGEKDGARREGTQESSGTQKNIINEVEQVLVAN